MPRKSYIALSLKIRREIAARESVTSGPFFGKVRRQRSSGVKVTLTSTLTTLGDPGAPASGSRMEVLQTGPTELSGAQASREAPSGSKDPQAGADQLRWWFAHLCSKEGARRLQTSSRPLALDPSYASCCFHRSRSSRPQ